MAKDDVLSFDLSVVKKLVYCLYIPILADLHLVLCLGKKVAFPGCDLAIVMSVEDTHLSCCLCLSGWARWREKVCIGDHHEHVCYWMYRCICWDFRWDFSKKVLTKLQPANVHMAQWFHGRGVCIWRRVAQDRSSRQLILKLVYQMPELDVLPSFHMIFPLLIVEGSLEFSASWCGGHLTISRDFALWNQWKVTIDGQTALFSTFTRKGLFSEVDHLLGDSHDGQIDVCRLVAMVIWS